MRLIRAWIAAMLPFQRRISGLCADCPRAPRPCAQAVAGV